MLYLHAKLQKTLKKIKKRLCFLSVTHKTLFLHGIYDFIIGNKILSEKNIT